MKVLLVDDEPSIVLTLGDALRDAGHETRQAETFAAGRDLITNHDFDCLITDLRLPDGSGLDLLALAREKSADSSLLVITAHQTIETAIEATKQGADYLVKPFLNEEVLARLAKIDEVQALRQEVKRLKSEASARIEMGSMVGVSEVMQRLFEAIRTIGPSDATVLITGESGTGKELAARAVHRNSPRCKQKLIKLSCASLPDTLLEDELFGHERGAFTDAKERKLGRFEMADGGSIFLDDIDDMSLSTQVKLLRVLQEREFERLGGSRTIQVDVRVIVATKIDLSLLVQHGRFRGDLYYRLNVVNLPLPPLRERMEDLPALVAYFLVLHGGGREYTVDEETLKEMGRYNWPGNIREVEHAVMRAIAMSGASTTLDRQYLLQRAAAIHFSQATGLALPPNQPPWPSGGSGAGAPTTSVAVEPLSEEEIEPPLDEASEMVPLRRVVMEAERAHIDHVLAFTGGNRTRTAQLLGISRKNLWEKMKEFGLK